MTRIVFPVGVAFLFLCLPLQAAIVISIPDLAIPYTDSSASFTVTAEVTGSYTIDSYSLNLALTGMEGATGVTFNGATEADSDYFLADNLGWSLVTDEDFELAGDDGVNSSAETITDATRYMITVLLDVVVTAADIGDKYDVTFEDVGGLTDIYDESWASITGVTWDGGVIEIIPEPSTAVLLGFAALCLLGHVWRRCRAGR